MKIHTGEKPFECEYCEKAFRISGDLVTHKRIHTGEKPFKCDLCEKAFSDHSGFIKHKRIHNSEKPFKCNICEKSFRTAYDLTVHDRRIHTDQKKIYKCDICQKEFSGSSGLIKHKSSHTGVKPYKCHMCQKSFTFNSDLTRHNKSSTHINRLEFIKTKAASHQTTTGFSEAYVTVEIKEEVLDQTEHDINDDQIVSNIKEEIDNGEISDDEDKKEEIFAENFLFIQMETENDENDEELNIKQELEEEIEEKCLNNSG